MSPTKAYIIISSVAVVYFSKYVLLHKITNSTQILSSQCGGARGHGGCSVSPRDGSLARSFITFESQQECGLKPCSLHRKRHLEVFILFRWLDQLKHQFGKLIMGFLFNSVGKESACSAGDLGLIPGLGRSSGKGNGKPLQYPCIENPMDRGTWWAAVHGVHDWAINTETVGKRTKNTHVC